MQFFRKNRKKGFTKMNLCGIILSPCTWFGACPRLSPHTELTEYILSRGASNVIEG